MTYVLRVAVLVLYGCYAFSPIYLSVAAGNGHPRSDCGTLSQPYSLGIVWVNVLLSSLLEEEIAADMGSGQASINQQDPDLILIKKKRAVFREQYLITPAVRTMTGSVESAVTLPALFLAHEITPDPQHRETDGYRFLHAGPSPPQHLS